MRKAEIFYENELAGILIENDNGYSFKYEEEYSKNPNSHAVSLTLPLGLEAFENDKLFAFFDGLIPEGWLLTIAERNWKLNSRDRMGLLLACCGDCIGAVSVRPVND